MEGPSKEYIKGFNSGYIIAQYEPELAKLLAQAPDKENDYFKGFTSGKIEYEKDRDKKSLKKNNEGKDIIDREKD